MEKEKAIEEIKKSIIQNYVRGAFNETDIHAFQQTFHPEFAIINIQENGSFFLFTRNMWEEALKKRLADPNFDYKSISLQPTFRTIDTVGDNASVTIDLCIETHTVYTDFLLLKLINGKWIIVSKIYSERQQ